MLFYVDYLSLPKVLRAGFEPARFSTVGLKSTPLDHSGIQAYCVFPVFLKMKN